MFTGIVAAIGTVTESAELPDARRITIATPPGFTAAIAAGDSIAIDGVCQTVIAFDDAGFTVQAIGTTLSRTTMGELRRGSRVNLELALATGDRLGGHFVQGHVDGVGRVLSIAHSGEHVLLDVALPPEVADVTVLHGSITVHGVSLTVNALPSADAAQVALIPYTWEHTTLSGLSVGSRVNLEGDMLGRFVAHYLARRGLV
jgi:riboflavin synthase